MMKKFSSFLVVLVMLMSVSFTAGAQEPVRGDVDQDGMVGIADVARLVDNLLQGVAEGDVDLDGVVAISDVASLVDYLLKGSWPDDPVTPTEYESVDLGLPSGTLWATSNVGAVNPEDCGDYFAWGEVVPNKEYYWWETTAWVYVEDGKIYLSKYNTKSTNGEIDNKTELDPEDDAAYVNMGPEWRMPSRDQIFELFDYCTWEWIQVNGMNGQMVTGPNGNTVFFPASGIRLAYDLDYVGEEGFYWSRTLNLPPVPSTGAAGIHLSWEFFEFGGGSRCNGLTVRAVRASQN